eukprot:TRINITY_DN29444_c0_g1_i1.p1 TRINITY_DN29444_c0_g1~~TRINITY_DN29444_c0_g1_i1.p1  ORF type:complete len:798 (+),score=129.90 TRINITY_DN29444_c0_g1_i1:171-2564(+)
MANYASAGTDWKHDPDASLLATMLQSSRSTLPHIFARSEFWLFLGLHLMALGAYQSGWFNSAVHLVGYPIGVDWVDLRKLTILTTFIVAFYINQCLARYQHMYMLCKKITGTVHDFAYQARLFLRDSLEQPYDRLGCRFMAAATVMCFTELRMGRGVPFSDGQWKQLQGIGLLKSSEAEYLRNIPGTQRILILLHFAGEVVKSATKQQAEQDIILVEAVNQLVLFHQYYVQLTDMAALVVPFKYFYMITAIIAGNLTLLAYGMAITGSFLSPCIFVVIECTLIGMMEFAAHVWDPFGKDAVDFPVNQWVADCLDGLSAIMEYQHDGIQERWRKDLEKEKLNRSRFVIGRTGVDSILGNNKRAWENLDALTARFALAPDGYRSLQQSDGGDVPAGENIRSSVNMQKKGNTALNARSALKQTSKQMGDFSSAAPGERSWCRKDMDGLRGIIFQKINVLLLFVPAGIITPILGFDSGLVFALNFLGIIPLASLLGSATEALAVHTGQLVGGLLNATFGNAVEMIMCVQAIKAGLIRVVQGNLLGSVLSNLLLVLGMALLGAGLKFKDIKFNVQGAQANMICQVVASISLVLPTIFRMTRDTTDEDLLHVSHYCSIFLIGTYALFMYFQLGTHAEFFQDDGAEGEEAEISAPTAVALLFSCTLVVAACSEFLVDSIEDVSENYGMPKSFIGIILLPIVGNAAEHVTAVSCAMRGMIDLALGVAVGSSTQVSLFVVPFTVIAGWIINEPMTLQFRTFDTSCFMLSVFLVQSVLLNGHTNWLHGCMLLTTYLLIAGIVWFIPE